MRNLPFITAALAVSAFLSQVLAFPEDTEGSELVDANYESLETGDESLDLEQYGPKGQPSFTWFLGMDYGSTVEPNPSDPIAVNYTDKINVTAINLMLEAGYEHYNTTNGTKLCSTPLNEGNRDEELTLDNRLRHSRVVYCKDGISVRLGNLAPLVSEDENGDLTDSCYNLLGVASDMIQDIELEEPEPEPTATETYLIPGPTSTAPPELNDDEKAEWERLSSERDGLDPGTQSEYGIAGSALVDSSGKSAVFNDNYWLMGYADWKEDSRWLLDVGLERKGCPQEKDWVAVSESV